jgi:hypothetical protein
MSKKTLILLTLLSLFLAAVGTKVLTPTAKKNASISNNKAENDGLMSETERRAYVEKFIKIEDIKTGADMHINTEGESVPTKGLLRVKGVVRNTGNKTLEKAPLVMHFQDDQDKVLGSETQDVLQGRGLPGGESRSFSFTVRDRKEFTDRFIFKVR